MRACINNQQIRHHNKCVILELLYRQKRANKSTLARLAQISIPAVSNILQELESEKRVVNIDDESQTRGHSSGTWLIAPEGDWTLCLNVTPTSIECQVANACLSPKGEFEYLQIDVPTPQALLESAMRHVDHLDRLNFDQFKVSVKASDVFLAVESYRLLAKQIDQPLHLGITEAGGARSGAVKSAIGLGLLLSEGIGDTLRVSLAADPVEEIKVGFDILKSLRIRARGINFIACPTCSRQEFDVIGTVNALEQRLEDIITPMDVSIIGCVVNGPGEALVSTLGVTGGNKKSGLYEDGVRKDRLDNDDMITQLEARIRAKASILDEARRIDVQQLEK